MIKTIFATSFLALTTTMALAQESADSKTKLRMPTDRGSVFIGLNVNSLGGGVGVEQSNYTGGAILRLGLSPKAGYFLANNWAVGIYGNTDYYRGSKEYKEYEAGAGVFTRYYFGKATNKSNNLKKWRFFGEASYGRTYLGEYSDGQHQNRRYGWFYNDKIGAAAGANYFFNKNVALELGVNYNATGQFRPRKETVFSSQTIGYSAGLQVYFNRNKK